jgi:hypothetical protein
MPPVVGSAAAISAIESDTKKLKPPTIVQFAKAYESVSINSVDRVNGRLVDTRLGVHL